MEMDLSFHSYTRVTSGGQRNACSEKSFVKYILKCQSDLFVCASPIPTTIPSSFPPSGVRFLLSTNTTPAFGSGVFCCCFFYGCCCLFLFFVFLGMLFLLFVCLFVCYFSPTYENLEETFFSESIPACAFKKKIWVEISWRTLIPLFKPWSVHSG